jgi:hypothetical protein
VKCYKTTGQREERGKILQKEEKQTAEREGGERN